MVERGPYFHQNTNNLITKEKPGTRRPQLYAPQNKHPLISQEKNARDIYHLEKRNHSLLYPQHPIEKYRGRPKNADFLPQKPSHGRGQELIRVGAVAGDGLAWFYRRPYPFPVQQGRLASLLQLAVEVELRAQKTAKSRSGHQSVGKNLRLEEIAALSCSARAL